MITSDQLAIILGTLWAVSEALSLVPSVKANGVFQAIRDIIGTLAGKKDVK